LRQCFCNNNLNQINANGKSSIILSLSLSFLNLFNLFEWQVNKSLFLRKKKRKFSEVLGFATKARYHTILINFACMQIMHSILHSSVYFSLNLSLSVCCMRISLLYGFHILYFQVSTIIYQSRLVS